MQKWLYLKQTHYPNAKLPSEIGRVNKPLSGVYIGDVLGKKSATATVPTHTVN